MRLEKDAIGTLELPDNVYYGIQTFRAMQNFPISGTQVHPILNETYLKLKRSIAITNYNLNVLEKKKMEFIVKAVDVLLAQDFKKHFVVDAFQAGAGTSQNMNVNEVIANVANEMMGAPLGSYTFIHPNDDVNCSQSTNDTYPTSMRLATLQLSKILYQELSYIQKTFREKSIEFSKVQKSGRTHLQDATPMFLGDEFGAYEKTLQNLMHLLEESQAYLRTLGIGGSATGSGTNVPPGYGVELLSHLKKDFHDEKISLDTNLFSSMQSQLPHLIYSNALKSIALEFIRISNDLRLLSSGPNNGLKEIFLPVTQPGSSMMPGKINPSILEMATQVFFKILGNDQAMSFAMQAGQLELNVMMPLMAQVSLESTEILTNALRILNEKCLKGLTANVEQCQIYAYSTSQIATKLTPILGYSQVAELVKEALKKNISVIQLIKEKKILTDEQIQDLGSNFI